MAKETGDSYPWRIKQLEYSTELQVCTSRKKY